MSTKVLVAFATIYGSTDGVAEAVAQVLRESGAEVEVRPARDVRVRAGHQGAATSGGTISGATITSKAYLKSVEDALSSE